MTGHDDIGRVNGLSLAPMNTITFPPTRRRPRSLRLFLRQALACTVLLSMNVAGEPTPDLGLPDFGDASASNISPMEEQRMGAEFMRAIRGSVTIVDDPEIAEYIQGLGYRLLAHADPQPYPYTFFVVADPSVNAFAGPGGYIGVHSGLILASESESELASVLAHEIAHVTQHHLLRAIDKSNRNALPATAALIAALVLAGQNPQLGQAVLATTIASGAQASINFTRAHELEADRVGVSILAGAGFDPRSMPAFFEQLQQSTRFYESGAPELLRTHPVTTSRIADTRARAEQYPRVNNVDTLSYRLMRAKLRVLTSKNLEQTIDYFAKAPTGTTPDQEAARRYGHALAQLAAGHANIAAQEIDKLIAKDPDRIQYRLAQGQIASAQGPSRAALAIYGDALKLYPRDYALTIAYAQELLLSGQPVPARQALQDYLRTREPRPLVYKLLAQAENDAGAPVESKQALAEYAHLLGQTQSAIEHLTQALGLIKKDDFYRASRIEARLKELKSEAVQQASQHK